jgi:lipopolysaccharide transport system ATP-binding protein
VSDVVIRAEGLGKKYLIGHQSAERERYTALRDVVGRSLKGLGLAALDMARGRQIIAGDEVEEFWALKDVSFEIKGGNVVGIIGRNGAGKSTLLKILSRITEPSAGRVTIKGRVASLLEVGTGFHPELTGRENIYLNGAILGMTRAEIRKKFDEIVAFAEIEKFLDTPVKRYSSGMYVRLAFAVAAHLEPEILIVDEVLAVGDAEFQKKCLGKMQDVAGHGRTVLFVSHSMAAVQRLCGRGLLMAAGRLALDDTARDAIARYNELSAAAQLPIRRTRSVNQVEIDCLEASPNILFDHRHIKVSLEVTSCKTGLGALNLFISDQDGRPVGALSAGGMGAARGMSIEAGLNRYQLTIELPSLARGRYFISAEIADRDKRSLCRADRLTFFDVLPSPRRNESEVLEQAWGYGPVWFDHIIEPGREGG